MTIKNPAMPGLPKLQWRQTLDLRTKRGTQAAVEAKALTAAFEELNKAFRAVRQVLPGHNATPYTIWACREKNRLVLSAWWMCRPGMADKLARRDPRFSRLTPQMFDAAMRRERKENAP